MSDDLDALQARLKAHFTLLSNVRRQHQLPVVALEHAMDVADLSKMRILLNTALKTENYWLEKHWLVWIVYATEQGYDYDGDEYWLTFEKRMSRWDSSHRTSLRDWFRKFHKLYCGMLPIGQWANHFSIIAWPITHALLPTDLQGQLAKALYGLRYQLLSRLDQSPADVGRYMARMAHGGSSRFDNFLEQEELVGRIVLGILDHRTVDSGSAILPHALARIIRDLERARNARQWLHDTREAIEVARMRGVVRLPSDDSSPADRPTTTTAERLPAIRPSLSLKRTGTDLWTPVLEIPDFYAVADRSPDLAQFLKRTRCTVAGSSGVRPPGWLLSGAQRRVLESWPPTNAPVLTFQAANAAIEHLLASEGCISAGPTWLFRVGSDGQAVEVSNSAQYLPPNSAQNFPVYAVGFGCFRLCLNRKESFPVSRISQ